MPSTQKLLFSHLLAAFVLCCIARDAFAQDADPAAPPAPATPEAAQAAQVAPPEVPAEPRETEVEATELEGDNAQPPEAELPPALAPKNDATPAAATSSSPLAGFAGDTAFLRSADDSFVLLPSARLQVDGYFFKRESASMPSSSVLLRRARLELAGWVGEWIFFNIAGDFAASPTAGANPVAQSWQSTTDAYVGLAPFGNHLILQVGQFDAPFTLENRTPDKYLDFMERSLTVRAFGAPTNKETGAMLSGALKDMLAYYSVGVFNGEGQNYRNADNKYDVIGRAFVSPLALAHVAGLENVTIGGSVWFGNRGPNGLSLPRQTTQGGFSFLDSAWKITGPATTTPAELHQRGKLTAYALELNVPIAHRYGLRAEYVHKEQALSAVDTSMQSASSAGAVLSDAKLRGYAAYGEAYVWLIGDDSIVPGNALGIPPRLKNFELKPPKHGLMLAVRVDHIDERISTSTAITSPLSGKHRITAYELGLNYWYSRRFRATFNYVRNHVSGTSANLAALKANLGGKSDEHELLLRLAVAF